MLKWIVCALMGAVIVVGAAAAQAAKSPKPAKRTPEMVFMMLDANKDGKIALDEYLRLAKGQAEKDTATKRFKKLDTNDDGSLDLAEFKSARKPKKAMK